MGSIVWMLGCTVPADEPVEACLPETPPEGTVLVTEVACTDMAVAGGEGSPGDLWLANSRFVAVIRNPENSLTLVGASGGTLIDAAPWGASDRLHEVAPLVDGGALQVDSWTVHPDGVTLEGTVQSLLDAPANGVGNRRSVTWRIEPDSDWLQLDDADGLWLHASGDFERLGDQLWHPAAGYRHDGTLVADLGGALRLGGVTRIFVGDSAAASLLGDVHIAGRALNADEVVGMDAAGARVGRLPVVNHLFDGWVPDKTATVRAEATGRAPSATADPGIDLELPVGASASVKLSFDFGSAAPRSVRVLWTAADSRALEVLVPSEGATLTLGAGVHSLDVSAGPAVVPTVVSVELGNDENDSLLVRLPPRFSLGNHVAAALVWPADRGRSFQGTNLTSGRSAVGAGFDYAVFSPEDEVATTNSHLAGWPRIAARNGSVTTVVGGSVVSWPWTADANQPGHGAIDVGDSDLDHVLVSARGGVGGSRLVAVDAALLDAPPIAWTEPPDLVFLPAPFAEGPAAWVNWTSWLDAGAQLVPAGPVVWVPVDDPQRIGAVDVESALYRGDVSAGTGPLLTLNVDGAVPGDVLPERPFRDSPRLVQWTAGGAAGFDSLALIGTGGAVLSEWTPTSDDDSGAFAITLVSGWVVLCGWSAEGEWAATGAVWVSGPM